MYQIYIKKRILKSVIKLPFSVQQKLSGLLSDLRETGPLQYEWPNFSRIGENQYHCHLSRKWVACWQCENDSITIEVYYAGSRENAPY
ncbi:MAG: hypothetical protein EHJ94_08705 [Deltaproteobacteria bacterium]|nr:MAG: hypothetical protein EHJ94_08705 [Deltaproteobacteria bacterium]